MSNSVQMTLMFPLVLGVLLTTLQWAMISWANATALAAAQDGARTAAAQYATTEAGRTTAAAASNNGSLTNITITINRSPTQTTATVTGTALSIIPGYRPTITKTAQSPTERITTS
ncbi:hypothetical protein GCM10028820_31570 [Tessaracoccus terricola]